MARCQRQVYPSVAFVTLMQSWLLPFGDVWARSLGSKPFCLSVAFLLFPVFVCGSFLYLFLFNFALLSPSSPPPLRISFAECCLVSCLVWMYVRASTRVKLTSWFRGRLAVVCLFLFVCLLLWALLLPLFCSHHIVTLSVLQSFSRLKYCFQCPFQSFSFSSRGFTQMASTRPPFLGYCCCLTHRHTK